MKSLTDNSGKQLDEHRDKSLKLAVQVDELQAALENAWRELAQYKREQSSLSTHQQMAVLAKETELKDHYAQLLQEQTIQMAEKEASLSQTINELRAEINRTLDRAAWREDELRKEIKELQERCQSSEGHQQDIPSQIAEATQPLLRQIESLRAAHAAKQIVWEELQQSLNQRIHESENRALVAEEKEREVVTQMNEINLKLKMVESHLSTERSTVSRLTNEIASLRSNLEDLDKSKRELDARFHVLQEKLSLTSREAMEIEEKLTNMIQQKEREATTPVMERKMSIDFGSTSSSSSLSSSSKDPTPSSSSSSREEMRRVPSSDSLVIQQRRFESLNPSLPSGSLSASSVERLQSLVQQRDGEILALQQQISSIEKSRLGIEEELIKVLTKLQIIEGENRQLEKQKAEHEVLKARHDTLLELMGERDEKVEELKADIEDMRQLYRTQIDSLVTEIETLRRAR
eukprot:TRINITY_DN2756_c0_g2_i1.p1 TRINITY_DN2756_c0_g2~~TRINITY_DN2756_c0_g2_i1.p1  ORF type:complete len:462 (+),score=209.88 TRINITY_DN2756_c0_g2_i1:419-1804(+)